MNHPPDDDSSSPQAQVWEHGWNEHEQLQLKRLARLTMIQKLQWLEDAHRVVRHLQASRNEKNTPPPSI